MNISVEMTDSNCYMVSTEAGAIIIDPYEYTETVQAFVAANSGKPIAVLLTHCHFDHIKAAPIIRRETGAPIYINENDDYALSNPVFSLASYFGDIHELFSADVKLTHNQEFTVGDISVTALHTPGHSPGCCCYKIGDVIFTGDTLFMDGVGRTDFPTGDTGTLIASLKYLANLPGDYTLYPGHGPKTTLSRERLANPYLNGVSI